jgi:hypothetical protein
LVEFLKNTGKFALFVNFSSKCCMNEQSRSAQRFLPHGNALSMLGGQSADKRGTP